MTASVPELARRCAGLALLLGAALASCAPQKSTQPRVPTTRGFHMGFSAFPPRLSIAEILRTVDSASRHEDAALMELDVPWVALLADSSAPFLVRRDQLPLAQLFRSHRFPIVATLDVTNGLDRHAEARVLDSLGRSIADPAVQGVYRQYVAAFDSIVRPDWLALAMETNLIRAAAPDSVYRAVVTMTNAAAAQLRANGSTTKLMVSVQVETAWGRLGGGTGGFVGIGQDRADFPFVQVLGLSSYPYLGGFATPEDMPLDYYARLVQDHPLPMIVTEGGWTSASVGAVSSTPELQARYIHRQMAIADSARLLGVFQIPFTDLDLSSMPLPPGSILPLFAQLGLEDTQYRPKPALAAWDSALGRRYVGP